MITERVKAWSEALRKINPPSTLAREMMRYIDGGVFNQNYRNFYQVPDAANELGNVDYYPPHFHEVGNVEFSALAALGAAARAIE